MCCSCIAERRNNMGGRSAEDLRGHTFGLLTAVKRVENKRGRTCWLCRCRCGGQKEVTAHDLKEGKVKSCGCLVHSAKRSIVDISGQRFGRLTALRPTERRDRKGTVCWLCRCDCGNECEVSEAKLMSGNCKSCGCLNRENQEKIKNRLTHVDGTCIEFLEKRKSRRDNRSGFRGVFRLQNGKYRVSIGFQGKRISLGSYGSFDDAVKARLDAEKEIHGKFLEKYHQWEEKAERDPEWAKQNPFTADVL